MSAMARTLRWTTADVEAHQSRIASKATGVVERTADGVKTVNLPTLPKKSKFRNERCVVDGERFDSRKEADHWRELRLRQVAGEIKDLRRQVAFELKVDRHLICTYVADFVYLVDGRKVVEDTKGYKRGPVYRLFQIKAALMHALHRLKVVEV